MTKKMESKYKHIYMKKDMVEKLKTIAEDMGFISVPALIYFWIRQYEKDEEKNTDRNL